MNSSDAESNWGPCYDSSMPEPNDQNLLNFIATTVETLRVRIDAMSDQMAGMATKVDLANLRDEMATKEDLARVESNVARVESNVARVESNVARLELNLDRVESQMATKDGLARLETTMHGEFERVHIRIDSLDRGMGSRMGLIETDVSRLRSVLYLLVKDKPDMLRLLGQSTSGESRTQR
jgi:hypothetical protein